jgi:CheY-like chemotaxis protein
MTTNQHLVMIVEDEPDTAEMYAEMMRLSGYQVRKTYGGAAAIAAILQEKPKVVLLDIMMPDVSGLEVLRFMKRDPALEHIPVVVVSAKTMPDDIRSGLRAGASAYLTKPVGLHELADAIRAAIQAGELAE